MDRLPLNSRNASHPSTHPPPYPSTTQTPLAPSHSRPRGPILPSRPTPELNSCVHWLIVVCAQRKSLQPMPWCYICGRWLHPPISTMAPFHDDGRNEPPPLSAVLFLVAIQSHPWPIWLFCDRWEEQWGIGWICICSSACAQEWQHLQLNRFWHAAQGGG